MFAMQVKQKSLQTALSFWFNPSLCDRLWTFCIWTGLVLAATAPSQAQSLQFQSLNGGLGEQVAKVRLIAGSAPSHGHYLAGIDLTMPPGSHTYWQQPGEAGVPPVFVFSGSVNVAKATVAFPVPGRIVESGIEAFGYEDSVVFPVTVTPTDAAKPAVLRLDMTYAVCNKICIPAHNTATITLRPNGAERDGADSLASDGAKLQAAVATVPVPATPADAQNLTLVRDPTTKKPSWEVTWHGTGQIEDLFAVAPDGFYFETKKIADDRFRLTAVEALGGAAKTAGVPVDLTVKRKDQSLVVTETLDASAATR
jgi:DsbC/DsbD-like thiol-disulfide interchange protein